MSPLVFLLQVRLCKRMVSVMAIPIKPKDSVIPFLSSPPLPRPVLVSKDVFLKSSLASAAPRDPPPPSGPLPVWKCPVCGYENFSKFGKLPLFTTTGMLTLKSPSIFMPLVRLRLFRKLLILFPLTSGPGLALYAIKVPSLPPGERMRATKKHIKDHHPDETPRPLDNKRRIGSKAPPTFRESISRHLLQVRQKQYPTHHLIMVVTPRPDWDRRNFWCSDCFGVFKATTGTAKFDQPCKMRQQEMATNGWVLARKRYWWNNPFKNNPEAAQEFLRKAGLTLESVNSTLRVGVETDSAKRWQRITEF